MDFNKLRKDVKESQNNIEDSLEYQVISDCREEKVNNDLIDNSRYQLMV